MWGPARPGTVTEDAAHTCGGNPEALVEMFLLSLHVVAAIIVVGPLTVAVSLFPRYARTALGGHALGDQELGDQELGDHAPDIAATRSTAVLVLLHRISRGYAVVALSVPVAGLALAARMHVLGDPWIIVSLALTVGAALLLGVVVLPDQNRIMAVLDAAPAETPPAPGGVGAAAPGLFALIWVVVVVLMVARPGSTTGV